MKRSLILLSLVALNLPFTAFILAAHATTYADPNTATAVVIDEGANSRGGFYFRTMNGREILGDIRFTSAGRNGTIFRYQGTFTEYRNQPGTTPICTGNITLNRTQVQQPSRYRAQVNLQITGGTGCPDVGKNVVLNLIEPLPRPDAQGNFTPANSTTWVTQTAGNATWPKWQVVSGDGELNCRVRPNGTIKQVYRRGEAIFVEGRLVDAIEVSSGSPWLMTRAGCYVRANSRYIQPLPLPF